MICSGCGKEISDNANFCSFCGNRVEKSVTKKCPECGRSRDARYVFCEYCGTLLVEQGFQGDYDQVQKRDMKSQSVDVVSEQICSASEQHDDCSDKVIKRIKMVNQYEGEQALGIAKATGELCVYKDRIVFKKQMGNAIGGAFGVIGLLVARQAIKNTPEDIYPYSELVGIHVGKYAGVYNTLVLVLQNDQKISFVPSLPSSKDPEEIIALIRIRNTKL